MALTVQKISGGLSAGTYSGLTPALDTSVAATETFVNDGRTFLWVKNANGSPCVVAVDSTKPCSQGHDHDISVSVPATTGEKMFGPFPVDEFGEICTVTFSVQASVSALPLSLAEKPR